VRHVRYCNNTTQAYILRMGLYVKQWCNIQLSVRLISISWPCHHHLHLIYRVWAQTHCLTGGKHLGCYSHPPLKESRPEIRCEGLFKEREACYLIPTSIRASDYLASRIREANWARHFLILALCRNFCLKNFLHWLPWSIVTLGGIQNNTVLHSQCTESTTSMD
jgi:hypothetical protein